MIKHITKQLSLLVFAMLLSVPLSLSALDGSKSVGLRGGYNTHNHSGSAGIFFQYRFSHRFRLAADADYVFRHHDLDGSLIDLNAHVPFEFGQQRFSVYPLVGLNYSVWSQRNVVELIDGEGTESETSRLKRFGLNLGAGAEMRVTSSLKLFVEGKYTLVKHADCGAFNIGIGYCF